MQNDDLEGLVVFCRRSSYDIVQALLPEGWGPAWTFDGSNLAAAQRTARMLRTLHGGQVEIRHARKIRYRRREGSAIEVMLLSVLPDGLQTVVSLEDGETFATGSTVADESLNALRSALRG